MNREIKFRVWDILNKEWKTNISINCDFSAVQVWGGGYSFYTLHPDRFLFQQYTGVKDKDGKEIYEGDILSISTWDSKYKNLEVKWQPWGGFNLSGFTEYGEAEVIGNIFENKELAVE